jgi:hypothetical protein
MWSKEKIYILYPLFGLLSIVLVYRLFTFAKSFFFPAFEIKDSKLFYNTTLKNSHVLLNDIQSVTNKGITIIKKNRKVFLSFRFINKQSVDELVGVLK